MPLLTFGRNGRPFNHTGHMARRHADRCCEKLRLACLTRGHAQLFPRGDDKFLHDSRLLALAKEASGGWQAGAWYAERVGASREHQSRGAQNKKRRPDSPRGSHCHDQVGGVALA